MSYSPLWTRDAGQLRECAAGLTAILPSEGLPGIQTIVEGLRGDFPDVDAELVGWITLRATHIFVDMQKADMSPRGAVAVMFMVGDRLVGES